MSLLIPYARNPSGKFITPISWNTSEKIICNFCGENLICRRGKKIQWHFSHYKKSSCSRGGGESAQHKAAKLILSEYMYLFEFIRPCPSKKHKLTITSSKKYVTKTEYNIPGSKMIADVAILTHEGILKGIVEVKYSRKTSDEVLELREEYAKCVEVNAKEVIDSQRLIDMCMTTGKKIPLHCINSGKTKNCNTLCVHPEYYIIHEKTLCAQCQNVGEGYVEVPGDESACPRCCIACPVCDGPMLKRNEMCGDCNTRKEFEEREKVRNLERERIERICETKKIERKRIERIITMERERRIIKEKRDKIKKETELKNKQIREYELKTQREKRIKRNENTRPCKLQPSTPQKRTQSDLENDELEREKTRIWQLDGPERRRRAEEKAKKHVKTPHEEYVEKKRREFFERNA